MLVANIIKKGEISKNNDAATESAIEILRSQFKIALNKYSCELIDRDNLADIIAQTPKLKEKLAVGDNTLINQLKGNDVKKVALGTIYSSPSSNDYRLLFSIYDIDSLGKIVAMEETYFNRAIFYDGQKN